jgi:pyrroline-5-carboxylate reductase
MGGALAAAAAKALGGGALLIADRDTEKAAALAAQLGATAADNDTVAAKSDYIFLGVKPQMMGDMLVALQPALAARQTPPVLVSMAAGLTTAVIRQMAGTDYPLIRIMPNTPAMVGEGMILYTAAAGTGPAQVEGFRQAMTAAGRLGEIEERLMDAASAVSGCGPAFAYLFIEALADGGVECGLPRQMALDYAAQTVLGAARMVLQTGQHPGVLKDAVCSPGGTTIAGVHALESGGFRSLAMDAVTAAYDRTLELAKNK